MMRSIARSASEGETVVELPAPQGGRYLVGNGQLLLGAVLPTVSRFDLVEPVLQQLQQQRVALLCYRPEPALPPAPNVECWRQLARFARQHNQVLMGRVDDVQQLAERAAELDVVELASASPARANLLAEVGRLGKPVVLHRGRATHLSEWLRVADWLYSHGCQQLILGEGGHYLPEQEHTLLDLSLIHHLRERTHLPLLVDASACCRDRQVLRQTTMSVVASEVHALLIPVQQNDGDKGASLGPEQRSELLASMTTLCRFFQQPLTMRPRQAPLPVETSTGSNIAFQGEEGAYSEQAALHYFGKARPLTLACRSFADVFQAVRNGVAEAGVLPIENTLGGTLIENYSLLRHSPDVCISGELRLRIKHNLISCPGTRIEQIQTVRSHPQALAQCDAFLEHLAAKREPVYDTAGAVKALATRPDPQVAAIASSRAAMVYRMQILQSGIETDHQNYTRFVVVRRRGEECSNEADKVSLVLAASHRIGSLAAVLNILTEEGFDLTKLESHPIYGEPWRYHFFIDARTPESYNFARLSEQLQGHVLELLQLGHYREDTRIYSD